MSNKRYTEDFDREAIYQATEQDCSVADVMARLGTTKSCSITMSWGQSKAALEACIRYLAHEFSSNDIRVNKLSAWPVKIRVASGIEHFEEYIREPGTKSPQAHNHARRSSHVAMLLTSDYASAWLKEHPYTDSMKKTRTQHEREAKERGSVAVYSILRDWIKGQITAIETGVLSFEGAFLGQILLPSGKTVLETAKDKNLLPAPEGDS